MNASASDADLAPQPRVDHQLGLPATVEQARESFLALGASVQDMNGRVEQIAAAIQQIASSSQQVQADMTEVAAVAEQSSASS